MVEKNFRIQIRAYGYYADFIIQSADDPTSIENALVDKLGKNEVKWESTGSFLTKSRKWITYEEVQNDASRRPVSTKEVLGVSLATGPPHGGAV